MEAGKPPCLIRRLRYASRPVNRITDRVGGANGVETGDGDTVSVLDPVVPSDRRARVGVREPAGWARSYLRWAALADGVCSLLGGGLALYVRFVSQQGYVPASYVAFA